MTKIGVLGAGAWGTALANVCARSGAQALLWGRNAAEMEDIERRRENVRRLAGVRLAPGVVGVSDLAQAAAGDLLLAVVPTQAFRTLAQSLAVLRCAGPLIICAKGIERGSGAFLSDISREILPAITPGVLSGPSFARDVAAGLPTAVTLALPDQALADRIAALLATPSFRLYSSKDVRGAEIGGAAKNVLAIACGLAVGRALGASAVAALVARGFAEIRRFGESYGARGETLMGLSGLGDVVLTCSSAQSRNFTLGLRLGEGMDVAQALQGELAEGAFTASVLVSLARKRGLEMPIAEAVDAILACRLNVDGAIDSLLARPLRSEH